MKKVYVKHMGDVGSEQRSAYTDTIQIVLYKLPSIFRMFQLGSYKKRARFHGYVLSERSDISVRHEDGDDDATSSSNDADVCHVV